MRTPTQHSYSVKRIFHSTCSICLHVALLIQLYVPVHTLFSILLSLPFIYLYYSHKLILWGAKLLNSNAWRPDRMVISKLKSNQDSSIERVVCLLNDGFLFFSPNLDFAGMSHNSKWERDGFESWIWNQHWERSLRNLIMCFLNSNPSFISLRYESTRLSLALETTLDTFGKWKRQANIKTIFLSLSRFLSFKWALIDKFSRLFLASSSESDLKLESKFGAQNDIKLNLSVHLSSLFLFLFLLLSLYFEHNLFPASI